MEQPGQLQSIFAGLVCGVGFTLLLLFWRTERSAGRRKFKKRKLGKADEPVTYNLRAGQGGPALRGKIAKLGLWLVNSYFGRVSGLKDYLMKQGNVFFFRDILMEDPPTVYPLIAWERQREDGSGGGNGGRVDLEPLLVSENKRQESDFRFREIKDYYDGYRSGKLTPSKVAENIIAAITRSENMEPKLRAFIEYNTDEIRKAARESTERFSNKQPLSVLDGIPIGVKDEIRVAGHHLRQGSTFMGQSVSEEDAVVISRLRASGAVIVGVTNMQENGMGTTGINISKYHGTPRNPYNVNHFTGGSSSGSAAAVAAGLCPVAMGTDGGGSVRIPSAFCGVVGFKPTFGRVTWQGSPITFTTVAAQGPLCTSVRDAAIMYAVISGISPCDKYPMVPPPMDLDGFNESDLKGLRLGIDKAYFKHADPEIVICCEKAVRFLESRGAEVVSIQIPELEEARTAHLLTILSEMRFNQQESFWNQLDEQYFENAALMSMIESMTITDFLQAQQQKTRTITFLKEIFKQADVILTPGCAVLAPKINPVYLKEGFTDTKLTTDIMRYAFLANFTGLPALVVPVGYSMQGLPIALQIQGAWWQESKVLRVGRVAEEFLEHVRKPQAHFQILD
ncbi:fatty acid amide hydrolase-like [Acanthaster planci]|uniref:Fatty acid amide hydrolase-like n=1 Tax=Acanthaster planci TaxID=133434 RepID=A0A8B7Z3Z7_ACAPL|nr:fatty acid amide hydrolase-like [Acanthaster planci]